MVVDPNIGTVVMGEWNETLFHRFFAKRNPLNWLIEDHGAVSMMVRLRKDGYLKIFSTNNLWAKYAFTLPDEYIRKSLFKLTKEKVIATAESLELTAREIRASFVEMKKIDTYEYFKKKNKFVYYHSKENSSSSIAETGAVTTGTSLYSYTVIEISWVKWDQVKQIEKILSFEDELHFVRAQLSIARFFRNSKQLIPFIMNTFAMRVQNGQALWDISDVLGKPINEGQLLEIVKLVSMSKAYSPQVQEKIGELTQDERFVLAQYLSAYNLFRANSPEFKTIVQRIVDQSLNGTSQIMVFELLE